MFRAYLILTKFTARSVEEREGILSEKGSNYSSDTEGEEGGGGGEGKGEEEGRGGRGADCRVHTPKTGW